MHVLIVEDHAEVAELVGRALQRDGHRVSIARSMSEADARLLEDEHDAAVVDLGLPDGDGLSWCKRIRGEGWAFPILLLTAQSAVSTRVAGLDAGADDFLAKPFAVAELRARLRALGRRAPLRGSSTARAAAAAADARIGEGTGGGGGAETSRQQMQTKGSELKTDALHLDFAGRRARVMGNEVPLTSREWSIVELLVSRSGRIVSRSDIMEKIWGESSTAAEASLEVLIGRIRKKLGVSFIRTLRGEGYAASCD